MADRKISDLTALTTPAAGDYLPIIDISEPLAANKNKRITIEELLRGAPNGTAGAPGFAFESDPDSGLYRTGENGIALSTGGTGRLFVDASGRVGIGTASASGLFHVANTGTAGTTADNLSVFFSSANRNATVNIIAKNTESSILNLGDGDSSSVGRIVYEHASNYMAFDVNASERLRITSTGQLSHIGAGSSGSPAVSFNGSAPSNSLVITSAGLVGVGTSSPGSVIHARGGAIATQSIVSNFISNATARFVANHANEYGAYIGYANAVNDAIAIQSVTNVGGVRPLLLNPYGSSVGIGTTSPSNTLHVAGIARIANSAGGELLLEDSDEADGNRPFQRIVSDSGSLIFLNANRSGTGTTGSTERARIDSSGRLLIGASGNFSTGANLQNANSNIAIGTYLNTSGCYEFVFLKSRGTTVGTESILNSGDLLGQVTFRGSDGVTQQLAATINARVDASPAYAATALVNGQTYRIVTVGTTDFTLIGASANTAGTVFTATGPGTGTGTAILNAGNMPGRLVFSTTADGSVSPTERLRITSAGLVGIGTSSPVSALHIEAAAGSSQLSIGNTALAVNANDLVAGINFFIKDNNDATGATCGAVRAIASQAHTLAAKGTELAFYTTLDGTSTLSERVRIDDAGRVGIGTASPTSPLHVVGSARIYGQGSFFGDQTSLTNRLILGHDGTSAFLLASGDNTNKNLVFFTDGGAAERARIDSSGRLLVGTSSSSGDGSILQVRSDTGVAAELFRSSANDGPAFLTFNKSRGTAAAPTVVNADDRVGGLVFKGYSGTAAAYVEAARIQAFVDGEPDTAGDTTDMPGRLVFSTTADGASSPTERMRITSNGRAVFGGLTTTTGLTTSNILVGTSNSTTGAVGIEGYTTITTERFHASFANGNGVVGSISTNGSATAYNTSSDYRLKENITAVTDGITRLQQLKPSRFNFIADPAKTVDGFLAHEVQTIVPEAITGEKDAVDDEGNPQYQGIDQSKLVPLLTAALQEAIAKIETLEAKVAALETK